MLSRITSIFALAVFIEGCSRQEVDASKEDIVSSYVEDRPDPSLDKTSYPTLGGPNHCTGLDVVDLNKHQIGNLWLIAVGENRGHSIFDIRLECASQRNTFQVRLSKNTITCEDVRLALTTVEACYPSDSMGGLAEFKEDISRWFSIPDDMKAAKLEGEYRDFAQLPGNNVRDSFIQRTKTEFAGHKGERLILIGFEFNAQLQFRKHFLVSPDELKSANIAKPNGVKLAAVSALKSQLESTRKGLETSIEASMKGRK
jgi:hypothetical protein